ncbi:cobalt-precorrin-7 (C(5))-methyltransferase [Halomicrobium sp. LC1Hm]|uniref:cobalt-precorrin-7 (C(5))-methyltransferase n=1 Tax=Halomicrobium sp. LC1Hm TaxID=2610902 RepID=UPI0012983C25|nr:cobalt-precorrin-7 (C(5))-methyltransferase [Halomicrobium sp. LC1Hm]QGA82240.1 Cobalt-precorrin-7 (C5)-methyltransferase [Halomicrobium sp. LC1Hm]
MSDDYDLDAGPDPAAFAAASPEVESPADPVAAVGIGPGNPDYLTPRGERAIREADVVVGFETVVGFVDEVIEGDALTCGYRDESETLDRFAERVADGESGTALLMGDPNHSGYQFVGKVQRAVDRPVAIVPGISSLQVAASRARTPMEATTFVTLHKSGDVTPDLDRLRDDAGRRHLLVLPRPYDWMPGDIAAELLDAGANPSLEALVFEHLTHDEEARTTTTLDELASHAGGSEPSSTPFSDLSVLAVRTA